LPTNLPLFSRFVRLPIPRLRDGFGMSSSRDSLVAETVIVTATPADRTMEYRCRPMLFLNAAPIDESRAA